MKIEHVEEISKRLKVKKEEVISMNRRMLGKEKSLNDPIKNEDGVEWQDWLVDNTVNQEEDLSGEQEFIERKKVMKNAMNVLSKREKEILSARRLSEKVETLEDLSKKHNISRERVRQIEVKAFNKLQKAVLAKTEIKNNLLKN